MTVTDYIQDLVISIHNIDADEDNSDYAQIDQMLRTFSKDELEQLADVLKALAKLVFIARGRKK